MLANTRAKCWQIHGQIRGAKCWQIHGQIHRQIHGQIHGLNVGKYTGNRLGVSGNSVRTVNGSCHSLPGVKGQHAQPTSTKQKHKYVRKHKHTNTSENKHKYVDAGGWSVFSTLSNTPRIDICLHMCNKYKLHFNLDICLKKCIVSHLNGKITLRSNSTDCVKL